MKAAFFIIAIGVLVQLTAAWMKITHQAHADFVRVSAYVVEAAGLLLLIYTTFFKQSEKRSH